jgi:squalene cyclase
MISKRKKRVEQAIVASLTYIVAHQSEAGNWVDWRLPTGESDAWTTAYVGCKLRALPDHLRIKASTWTGAASEWVLENEYSDGGWGYNEGVGSDADSTAYAILFLASEGKAVPARSYARLKGFQMADGGFSTYVARSENDSWGFSHPDVTPIALLALLTEHDPEDASVSRGIEYALKQRTPGGWWNSFWWDSFLYSTQANLSLLNAVKAHWDATKTTECLLRTRTKNVFEAGLLASSVLQIPFESRETKACELTDQLIREQRRDGSWESRPILRLTKDNCFEPWNCEDAGILFSDPERLFTSSTVLEALCMVYAFLQNINDIPGGGLARKLGFTGMGNEK